MISSSCVLLTVLVLVVGWIHAQNPVYQVTQRSTTNNGVVGQLKRVSGSGPYGNDVDNLMFQVEYLTDSIAHVKIADSAQKRWQVPFALESTQPASSKPLSEPNYKVVVPNVGQSFALQVLSTFGGGYSIFNTKNSSFVFSDQYLSLSTDLPGSCKGACEPNLYGLGERVDSFRLDTNRVYTLFNNDDGNTPQKNLYGSHAFYLEMRDGIAHGVFLLNSNAMDVVINWSVSGTKSLTYKTIGGVLDFYFFVGPTPAQVLQQYQSLIGKPYVPPFWSFGFHQCRWGYKNLQETADVVKQYKDNNIPLETMWNDIDYMDAYKVYTWNKNNFPQDQVKQFVDTLHQNNQHYVVIVDPGVKVEKGYSTYDSLIAQNLYIKKADGVTPIVNTVWPGATVFPDFTMDQTHKWWADLIHTFLDGVAVDGLWIDMNEMATFCNGQCGSTAGFDPYKPPYVPGGSTLEHKTLSLNATTMLGPLYNTHNLYGFLESIATRDGLASYPAYKNKRQFVLTRSTFVGSGRYVAHWTGDNDSTYQSMKYSISGNLAMNLFGISMVGSDICGFNGDTTEELCTRWMELGTFYAFSRNHNAVGAKSQEPYAFGKQLAEISSRVILQRYSLLQHYYTIFYHINTEGGAFWRPLFFEFPADPVTYGVEEQFLVGPSLLVSPVLNSGQTSVNAYFPAGRWYDLNNGDEIKSTGQHVTLDAPIDHINVHLRGGYTVARQTPAMTLTDMKFNEFTLFIALNDQKQSVGDLYLDDGENLNAVSQQLFTHIEYHTDYDQTSDSYTIYPKIIANGYPEIKKYQNTEAIYVYGIETVPCNVLVNGKPVQKPIFTSDVLTLKGLSLALADGSWKIQILNKC